MLSYKSTDWTGVLKVQIWCINKIKILKFIDLLPVIDLYWRASVVSETLSGVYKFELMRYVYIYIYVWRYVCHNSSACHVYVM